jgi:hypothetical protein
MINLYVEKTYVRLILSVVLLLIVAQVAHPQDLLVNNNASNIGSGRYKWTVYVEGDKSALSRIDYVEYRLPDVYGDKAVRKVSTPRVGKSPFSLSDVAFEPFAIGVTIFFRGGKSQKLPDYALIFGGAIPNPGGVAVTEITKLKEKSSVEISVPEFQGAIYVYIHDLHDVLTKKAFYIKISNARSTIKETNLNPGPNVSLPFSYDGHEYVLSGYTKMTIFKDDYLFFRIYRKR